MKKKIMYFLSIAILLSLAIISAVAMLSDIYAYQAKRYELRWAKVGYIESIDEWNKANHFLSKALALSSEHPDYLLLSGRIALWRFFVNGEAADEVFSESRLKDVKQALSLRPYWAEGWAHLAAIKAKLHEVDGEFWHAYQAALTSGPWEPAVMTSLLGSGLLVWGDLSWRQREEVVMLFARISVFDQYTAKKALEIVARNKMKFAFCLLVKRSEVDTHLDQECAQP